MPTPGRPGSRGRSGSPAAISHRTRFVSPSPSWFLPRDATLYDNRRVVAAYYKSANCHPLAPLLRFAVDLLYSLFLQLTDIARRVVRLRSRASCWSKRRKTNNVPYQNEIKRREEQFTEIEKPVHALILICGDPFEQVKVLELNIATVP